jgi:hypothetical protein
MLAVLLCFSLLVVGSNFFIQSHPVGYAVSPRMAESKSDLPNHGSDSHCPGLDGQRSSDFDKGTGKDNLALYGSLPLMHI